MNEHQNYTPANRPYDTPISAIVMHCTEVPFDRSLHLLTNREDASAHYLIDTDGRVTQIVEDRHIAWHAGNREVNARSIGIEVVGYVAQKTPDGRPHPFTDAQYQSAARLVRGLCDRYNIAPAHNETRLPGDRIQGDPGAIFGHDQVPDPGDPSLGGGKSRHMDPGAAWDWGRFMRLVLEE